MVFPTKGTGINIHMQKWTHLAPHTKINLKWIINLEIKPKTIKPPEENIGENLCDFGLGKDFLDTTRKAQSIKEKLVSYA